MAMNHQLPNDADSMPPVERRRQVADDLYDALVISGCSFWDRIYPLFLSRDITRHDMRELVRREVHLGAQLGSFCVVLGEERHHLLDAIAGTRLDELPDFEVLPCPYGLRQHLVGSVTDQRVLERQRRLACGRVALARDHDVLAAQDPQRLWQVAAFSGRDGHERRLPERSADHGRVRATLRAVYQLASVEGGKKCLLTVEANVDPAGWLPAWDAKARRLARRGRRETNDGYIVVGEGL